MSSLEIDVEALRGAATGMRGAADLVPLNLPIDASGCGSAQVIAAAEDFNMWAKVSAQILIGKLESSGGSADLAATAFETAESELAAAAGGTP